VDQADADQADGGDEQRAADRHRWQALGVCLVVGFMTLLDISIVNVALPSIEKGLHASSAELSWVISGYALTFGLVLVPAGRFGDARGRRTVFLLGLALFTLASAACGLATGPVFLVVARLAQGLAGGLLTPQVSGLIQELFQGAERGRAFGLFGTTIGISTAVGPLLGGLLIAAFGEHSGWRWVFFVNLPIGVGAFVAAARLLPVRPRDRRTPVRGNSDPLGVLLLGAGVVALLLPLVQEQQWHGSAKWALIPVSLVLLTCFVLWERRQGRRGRAPIVDLRLFRQRSYALGAVVALVYFAGFTAIFFIFTLYLQNGRGYSALEAGAAVTPFALGSAVSSAVGGRLVARYGRRLITLGLAMVAAGLGCSVLAVHQVPGHAAGLATALPLLLAGFGSGFVIAPNQTVALSEVPVRWAGSAGGVLQTGQRIGSATGIAAVSSVFFSRLAASHGDWARAFEAGVLTALAFVVAALVIALVDLRTCRA
jgi:EmrB/QacA subfamily drug resistance transporter